ncbi:hypothetical protein D1831_05040 [Lactiplantibacillus garii]|uniref:Uncharacterized protein n=1 Tax=Lactiplantibacillus garii TaxID=2306423 RepID=A0A3R8KFJ0_9LACO|nr:hypothetical protein [Lactiplantibacillus garii]RRK10924.1 hypothetical protein D1831_05040 [Lactiplantibacillus garii]
MVKQGHYAKASRQKKLRQLKQRHQVHADRVIADDAIVEFLQVRYHLTRGSKQRPVVRKTMQHFVTQWLVLAQATGTPSWDVTTITKQTLQQFNRQLPWQGYALVNANLLDFQAFLLKEVPAVPLKVRLGVSHALTPLTWQALLTTQLAVNTLLGMFGDQLEKVTTAQVNQLRRGLIRTDGALDWGKVASLVAPVTMTPPDADVATQTWFTQLTKLDIDDFD